MEVYHGTSGGRKGVDPLCGLLMEGYVDDYHAAAMVVELLGEREVYSYAC